MNAYEILGVSQSDDDETIRKAYKKLLAKYHSDINKSEEAPKKWDEIQNAYNQINTPEKRQLYNSQLIDAASQSSSSTSTLNSPRRLSNPVSPKDSNFDKDPMNLLPKFAVLIKTGPLPLTQNNIVKAILVSGSSKLMSLVFNHLAGWDYKPTVLGTSSKEFLDPDSLLHFQFFGILAGADNILTYEKMRGFSIVFLYDEDELIQQRLNVLVTSIDPRNITFCELHYLQAENPKDQIHITNKIHFNTRFEASNAVMENENKLTMENISKLNFTTILSKLTERLNTRPYHAPSSSNSSFFGWFKRAAAPTLAIEAKGQLKGVLVLDCDEVMIKTDSDKHRLLPGVRNMIKSAQDNNVLVLIITESEFNEHKKESLDLSLTNHTFYIDKDVYDAKRLKTLFARFHLNKCEMISEIKMHRGISSSLPTLLLAKDEKHFIDANKLGIQTLQVPSGTLPAKLDDSFFSETVMKKIHAVFPEQSGSTCTIV